MARKFKNAVIKGSAYVAGLSVIVSGCMLDSEAIQIPLTVGFLSVGWLLLLAYANA